MTDTRRGRIVGATGGWYTVRLEGRTDESSGPADGPPPDGRLVACRARGLFRRLGAKPLVGDVVTLRYDDAPPAGGDGAGRDSERRSALVTDIHPRRNALRRPPLSNLDLMFVVASPASPAPDLLTLDKFLAILDHSGIEPVVVVGKSDLDPARAASVADIYRRAGFRAFTLSCLTGEGWEAFASFVGETMGRRIAALSGASGVGKTTLLNRLLPDLDLEVGDISRKLGRGKNQTRGATLYELPTRDGYGYLADTAGFTCLDFERFDFLTLEDLAPSFREFVPLLGSCRYSDCSHLSDEGCAVTRAVRDGRIPPSRYRSYQELYAILKGKRPY